MDPNSVTLGIAIGIAVLVFMRLRRRRMAGRSAAPARETKPRTMPRIGTPGTVTFNQIQALKRNNFEPDRSWSREEAALILDAVAYLRAVCRMISSDDDGPPPIEVQNELLRIALITEDVRDYIRKWGEERRAAGVDEFADDEPELVRNNQFELMAREARKFLAPAVGKAG